MKRSESTGNAVESLQVRSEGLSRSNWIGPVPNSRASPESRPLASRCGFLTRAAPGAPSCWELGSRWGGTCSGIARPPAVGSRSSPPSRAPWGPAHAPSPSPPGARGATHLQELADVSAANPEPGALRARLPLTLRRSRPSPRRPPGLRSPAAGVGVGGAAGGRGPEGDRRLAAQRRGEPHLPAPHSTLRRAPSAPPAPRPLLKGRAPPGSAARGQAQEMTSAGPSLPPPRTAGLVPGAAGPAGGGLYRAPAPSSPRRPHQLPQGTARAPGICSAPLPSQQVWDPRRKGTSPDPTPPPPEEVPAFIWRPVKL